MAINSRPFQKREGSKKSIFLGQEKPMLIPLPGRAYEMTTRKDATVNFNYHVAFGGAWYSAPFQYVKRTVTIVATARSVSYDMTVFDRCAMGDEVLLSKEIWRGFHSLLATVDVRSGKSIPYCLYYAKDPSPATLRFIEAALALSSRDE